MDIRNGNINNAKSEASLSQLTTDVCIEVVHRNSIRCELYLNYDNGTEQIITLSEEQRLHLIKVLTK